MNDFTDPADAGAYATNPAVAVTYFTNPADAVHEAEWRARRQGAAHAVVMTRTGLLCVLPLYNAGGLNVLEVCRP